MTPILGKSLRVRMTWYWLFSLSIVSGGILSSKDNVYKIIHSRSLFISTGVDCWLLIVIRYMYMHIIVQFVDTTHFAFFVVYVHSMVYSPTIIYVLHGWSTRTVQQLITLFATLFLLLLLIVIYDCVGKYDGTIIMDWYVGQCWRIMSTYLLNFCHVCVHPSSQG